jgi:hypothetical protein
MTSNDHFKFQFRLFSGFQPIDPTNTVPVDPDEPVIPPEVPSLGLHPTISGGSSCLELKTSETKGRYIVTNQGKLY